MPVNGAVWCGGRSAAETGAATMVVHRRSDSETLRDRTEILRSHRDVGACPADRPVALIAVRLNDVAPDGALRPYNLWTIEFDASREPTRAAHFGAEQAHVVSVTLNDIAHAFPEGHKIRLAVSTCYWPIAWPAPPAVTVSLFTGNSFVDLPVRPPDPSDAALRRFAAPERAAAEVTELRPAALKRILERNSRNR